MNYQVVLCLCLQLSSGIFSKMQRIVGGNNVHIRELPHQVSLRFPCDNQLICGGAIISEWHVLTAAHCLVDRQFSKINVYAGSNTIASNKSGIEIQAIYVHPGFTGKKTPEESYINDIAVILLRVRLVFNRFQNKIELPKRPTDVGEKGVISGWGLMKYPSEVLSATLQKAAMIIQDNSNCSGILRISIHANQLCAFQKPGIGACTGDSGGPLVSDGEIIGIASFVLPCGTGVPDVYTRVYPYIDYIRSVMNLRS